MLNCHRDQSISYEEPHNDGGCSVLCADHRTRKGRRIGAGWFRLSIDNKFSCVKAIKKGRGQSNLLSWRPICLAQLSREALVWNCLRRRKWTGLAPGEPLIAPGEILRHSTLPLRRLPRLLRFSNGERVTGPKPTVIFTPCFFSLPVGPWGASLPQSPFRRELAVPCVCAHPSPATLLPRLKLLFLPIYNMAVVPTLSSLLPPPASLVPSPCPVVSIVLGLNNLHCADLPHAISLTYT